MLQFICSLSNVKGQGTARELFFDDEVPADMEKRQDFVRREDRPGRGVFRCLNPLQPGAKSRCTETVRELRNIYWDIDVKDIEEGPEEIDRRLHQLPFTFTWVDASGSGGVHAGVEIKDPPLPGTPEYDHLCALWKRLAEKLCADPAPTHPAALIREPGTHNTKNGQNALCEMLWGSGQPVDISELDALDELLLRSLFTRKPKAAHTGNGFDHTADYVAGDKPPVNVEARLAAITFQGPGDSAIHTTWKDCLGSLLATGTPMQDAIEQILEATEARCQDDPRKATWAKQLLEIATWYLTKFPKKFLSTLDPDLQETWHKKQRDGRRPYIVLKRTTRGNFLEVRSRGDRHGQEETPGAEQETAGTRPPGGSTEPPKEGAAPPKPEKRVRAIPFEPFDEAALEARAWLYAKHYQRGQCTATIGPGGAGKSSLDLVEAIAMATCRNLLDEQPTERCRVWIHNGDDDAKEVKRRIAAVCRHYNIPMTELKGWLFATSKSDMTIKVAVGSNGSITVDRVTIRDIVSTVSENQIDVVILEPLVTLHAVPENDNVKMNAVIHIFSEIADGCSCAIDICHHTRKLLAGGGDEYGSDDGRGASSTKDAWRALRLINHISAEEARKAGIEEQERPFYFRVDRGKANYLPPATKATWRKFENVELLNGDNVGVVTTWDFQETKTVISDAVCEKIQADIRKSDYREHKQRSPEVWVGRVVAKHLGLNPNDPKSEWQISRALRDLENRGVIAYEMRQLPHDKRPISYAVQGPWKKPNST